VADAYVTANTAGILSHVAGGLKVIEAVRLSLVPGVNVVGALVAFRDLFSGPLLHRRRAVRRGRDPAPASPQRR
jgi:uncharacterized membrane protein YbhN (UPF0104 family)